MVRPGTAIRPEGPDDGTAIRRVHTRAFARAGEADLVDALRQAGGLSISLVAELAGEVIGHVAFSTVSGEEGWSALGLAPLGVLPDAQRRGVGSALVVRGLAECTRLAQLVVVVLGDPAFYARFGFVPARTRGLRCAYPDAGDAFMVTELTPGALGDRGGLVRYRPEFEAV